MLKLFLSALLVLRSVKGNCSEGCLKCSVQTNTCLFCDFSNNYFINVENICEKKEVLNCTQINFDGTCLECIKDYFPYEGECKEVSIKIGNCEVMKNPIECLYCKTGYYFANQKCTEVPNVINNCLFYSNTGTTCERCEEKAFLYIDKRYCVYLEAFEGCAVWSQINCKNCL